ncbi:MAG: 6-aminohexanoate hydrolase, partial [Pseudomonadota bacterium]
MAAALASHQGVTQPLDAGASDPNALGWMQGFPPAPERLIAPPASNYLSFPKLRWTFC